MAYRNECKQSSEAGHVQKLLLKLVLLIAVLTWDQEMAETASTAMAGHLRTHSGRGRVV